MERGPTPAAAKQQPSVRKTYNPCPVCMCPCWLRHTLESKYNPCSCCCLDAAGEMENSVWCCVFFCGNVFEASVYVERSNAWKIPDSERWCVTQSKCKPGIDRDAYFAADGCNCGLDDSDGLSRCETCCWRICCRPLSWCVCFDYPPTCCRGKDFSRRWG